MALRRPMATTKTTNSNGNIEANGTTRSMSAIQHRPCQRLRLIAVGQDASTSEHARRQISAFELIVQNGAVGTSP
ncbi:hypothetical protein GCM10010168_21790 [Actinoplanes ianthinogenes]|uniref:Uncharacterized protein n=1 Tax=Actinoplanes ianthinogenes TaxID=122358 RepID=A0ABM7M836_9ACTN|nr:hypothetical protein Aiant_84770 [Actinoplanes ianthinogenes]GGR04391.1 hypothetical protein GCM10010168_21790 [Actinoplanes ianthinogenes]